MAELSRNIYGYIKTDRTIEVESGAVSCHFGRGKMMTPKADHG